MDKKQHVKEFGLSVGIPTLRIFSIEKAKEFYLDFLEFKWDWQHKFEENAPIYCQISKEGLILHLSEHAGDGSPGVRIFIHVKEVRNYQKLLLNKNYPYMKPGLITQPWGETMEVIDPFSNKLIFCQQKTF